MLQNSVSNDRGGSGAVAERIRADLLAAKYKAISSGDRKRDRDFDKAIRNVRGTGADAERNRANLMAAKYGVEYKDFSYNKSKPTRTLPANSAPTYNTPNYPSSATRQSGTGHLNGSDGTVFNPAAGGYYSSKGEYCASVAGGISCSGRFIPVPNN